MQRCYILTENAPPYQCSCYGSSYLHQTPLVLFDLTNMNQICFLLAYLSFALQRQF